MMLKRFLLTSGFKYINSHSPPGLKLTKSVYKISRKDIRKAKGVAEEGFILDILKHMKK